MPKIKIVETDTTGNIEDAVSNVVYIPCISSKDIEPTLCLNTETLEKVGLDDTKLGYKLAKHLINLGLSVLVEGLQVTGDETFNEFNPIPTTVWTRLQDKNLYNIRFLTTGEFGYVDTNAIMCATERGDCIALCDHSKDDTNAADLESGDTVVSHVRSVFEEAFYSCSTDVDGAYATAFTPWFTTLNEDLILENKETKETAVPASFGYLFAYARSIKKNPEYYAVAGNEVGLITELKSLCYTYNTSECEILQARAKNAAVELDNKSDNVGRAINPIAYIRGLGNVIWGNRTLTDNNRNLKASAFLNIRHLACTIKKLLFEKAKKYTFEQNGDILWINFQSEILPTLDEMKGNSGILGYRFTKQATTAKARLKAKLTLMPIEAVEDFDLTVELSDSIEVNE